MSDRHIWGAGTVAAVLFVAVAVAAVTGAVPVVDATDETGTITGNVTDSGGEPLSSAAVEAPETGDEASVDDDGSYELDVPAAEIEVIANADGYESDEAQLTVAAGETETVDFELDPDVRVYDATVDIESGEGVPGEQVVLEVDIESNEGSSIDINELDIELEYDRDVLQYSAVNSQPVDVGSTEITERGGTIEIESDYEFGDLTSPPSTPLTAARLEFVVLGDPGDVGDISFSEDSSIGYTGDEVEADWEGGDIDVIGEDEQGPDEPQVGQIVATSEGGFVEFNEGDGDTAREEGVGFPPGDDPDGDIPIEIEGQVFDDGTWQSTDTSFPTLQDAALPADVEARDGLEGELDLESGTMTAEGELTVIVSGDEFSFDIGATTEDSGELSGDADLSEDGGAVTLVDNEFPVDDQTGSGLVDGSLGLPSPNEGDNWFELELDVSVLSTTGTFAGTVEDESGEPIDGAVVEVGDRQAEAGEDGSVELEVEAGDYDVTVDADGYFEETTSIAVGEDETVDETFTLEAGDPNFEASLEGDAVEAGEEVDLVGTVENTGDGAGEQDVTLSVADEENTETLALAVGDDETILLSWETDADDDGEYTAELDTGDATAEAEVTVSEADDNETDSGDDVLTATSQGGFIAFTEDTSSETTASDEGLSLPDEDDGDTPIELEADYNPDDNSWESTAVDFPNLDLGEAGIDGVEAEIDTPNGLEGTIDTDDNTMTVEGTLAVTAADGDFEFDIDATTDGSNDLDGDADLDDDGGTVTAVDNEYLIQEESGYDIMDNALDLPATTPGENWLTLSFDIDIEETAADTGDIEGTVESSTGDPIEDATVDIQDELDDTTTDDDGDFELTDVETGDYTLEITADGHADTTTDVTVDEDDTTTVDVELDADDPEMTVDVDVTDAEPGDTVALTATVENTGGAPGSEEVTATVGDETKTQTVEVDPGDTETVTLEWDVAEEDLGEHTAEIEGESFESTADVTVAEALGPDVDADGDTFVATSQGGFISFAEDGDKETAIEEGLEFPSADAGEEPIEIVGAVDDDGSWESSSIRFPDLVTDSGIAAEVSAPDGLSGEIDADSGEMSANGELSVAIEGDDDTQFSFEIATTVGESESLSGEASLDEEGGTATLVDNEFTVPDETGDPLIDGTLDLPATDEGTNWFELDLEVELDADDDATSQQQQNNEGTEPQEQPENDELGSTLIIDAGILISVIVLGGGGTLASLGLLNRRWRFGK
ncbi:carboxypeptidase-like regulatory domain-containing protein [Natronomonas pharaonis]|nr:carboxypeptidase-like regulatory domain-containing protein [Natronomonas pharaonis]